MNTSLGNAPLGILMGPGSELTIGGLSSATSEQDANSALLELDKSLRSSKVGEQCEGIVRYSRLFEKFPFPILINSAFLRLADVFIAGNNFLRLCILKVVQQSERHLDKIINVDEFLRRIFQVIHSNDPVARGVTLRLLGEMARIMPRRTSVHHAIRCALDSHDKVEMEAAIVAAGSFAKESKTFASSIFAKLTAMIDGLVTPADMKLKLIPIFQAMHHDNQLSVSVRSFLSGSPHPSSHRVSRSSFLGSNPSQRFVLVVLDTLTNLAAESVVDIPEQVELLIRYLRTDPRTSVKKCALQGLKTLADGNPHRWNQDSLGALLDFIMVLIESTNSNRIERSGRQSTNKRSSAQLLASTLQVLTCLSKSVSLKDFPVFKCDSPKLLIVFTYLCYHDDLSVASAACELYCDLAIHATKAVSDSRVEEAATALETFLVMAVQSAQDRGGNEALNFPINSVKRGMKCVIMLCRSEPKLAFRFISTISTLLQVAEKKLMINLFETLAAIGSYDGSALCACVEDIVNMLKAHGKESKSSSSEGKHEVELLCTLIFQAASSKDRSPEAINGLECVRTKILTLMKEGKGFSWTAYRVSRQASRYGHHGVALSILDHLSSHGVASSFLSAWLKGFYHLCNVEEILAELATNRATFLNDSSDASNLDEPISPLKSLVKATESAHLGVTQLSAASSPTYPLTFPVQLARLRAAGLQSCIQLLRATHCLRTCPPPAIASTAGAGATGGSGMTGDIAKGSRVSSQLHSVSKEFRALADQINALLQASFDADALSLKYLNLLRLSASILISAIDSLIIHVPATPSHKPPRASTSTQVLNSLIGGADASSLLDVKTSSLDLRHIVEACKSAMEKLSGVMDESRPVPPVDKRIKLIQDLCLLLIARPLPFPRYFFQSLQVTNIKLAISPQPKVIGEPITVMPETQMVLKVEGVIQYGGGTALATIADSGPPLGSVFSAPSQKSTAKKTSSLATRTLAPPCGETRHRNIHKIIMTVKTILQSRTASATNVDINVKPESTSQTLSRSVHPQNDYFCQQFLLSFPIPGLHHVAIQVSVQDEVGSEWITGPKTSLIAKVLEATDPSSGRRNQEPLIGSGNIQY